MPAEPFDIVICSLALHHFAFPDAVNLLQRLRSFARRGVVVADLARSDFGVVGIYLLTSLLLRHPMNRFDARLSMRRAFSFGELRTCSHRSRVVGIWPPPLSSEPTGDLAREGSFGLACIDEVVPIALVSFRTFMNIRTSLLVIVFSVSARMYADTAIDLSRFQIKIEKVAQ